MDKWSNSFLGFSIGAVSVESLYFSMQLISGRPLHITDTEPANMRTMTQKLDDDFCLPAFYEQVWSNLRKVFSEPVSFESEDVVIATSAGLSDGAICISHPRQDCVEQDAATLRNSNFSSESVIANPLSVVVANIFDNTDLSFSVEEASEVSDPKCGEHEQSFNGVVH